MYPYREIKALQISYILSLNFYLVRAGTYDFPQPFDGPRNIHLY
jgi:hypothetical protein